MKRMFFNISSMNSWIIDSGQLCFPGVCVCVCIFVSVYTHNKPIAFNLIQNTSNYSNSSSEQFTLEASKLNERENYCVSGGNQNKSLKTEFNNCKLSKLYTLFDS